MLVPFKAAQIKTDLRGSTTSNQNQDDTRKKKICILLLKDGSNYGFSTTLKDVCTGCAIKNWSQSFNLKCSHDRNPSNFKNTFICYYTELSFEVYTSFLGQLAQKWGVVKVESPKQEYLKKVHFTSLTGNDLNLPTIF